MAEPDKKEKEEHAEAAPKKGKKKLLVIVAIVLLAVIAGVIGFFAFGSSPKEGEGEEEEEKPKNYATAELDTFVVNLSQSGSFLKVKLLLEYDVDLLHKLEEEGHGGGGGGHAGGEAAGGGGLPGALGHRSPMIKDAAIRVLASKKGEELLTTEGKEQLKEELIEALNEATGLEEPVIVNVYYQEFLIQ